MSQLSRNLKAIQGSVTALNVQSREGRNDALRDYHAHITPGVRDQLTYTHGTQAYRDKTLEKFLDLINKRPIHMPIKFLGGDDNALLAAAAIDMAGQVVRRALTVKDTGAHIQSIEMFAREVGTRREALISERVRPSQLPERAVVSIIPIIDYASTLEARGVAGGILYHVAQIMRRKYGSELAVKYDYVGGKRFGLGGGTFPRIQLGHFGNLRSRLQKPGKTARRRRRGYAQVTGRSS